MNWKTKAAIFRAFELVPFGSHLHYWAQRNITKTWPRSMADVEALVGIARQNIADFEAHCAQPIAQSTFLEIGSGRDLVVPMAMCLLGARRVIATDIDRLARLDLVNTAADMAAQTLGRAAPKFESWDALDKFGVCYRAPFDAGTERLSEPVDAFVSNEVLEHIPAPTLKAIFSNVVPQMRHKISIHSIDYSDHYARGGGVSRYNFLQFSEDEWARFNPSMHYVNRLRHSEYIAIMEAAGLRIANAKTYSEDLPDGLSLAPEFRQFSPDDTKVMRARIIATA